MLHTLAAEVVVNAAVSGTFLLERLDASYRSDGQLESAEVATESSAALDYRDSASVQQIGTGLVLFATRQGEQLAIGRINKVVDIAGIGNHLVPRSDGGTEIVLAELMDRHTVVQAVLGGKERAIGVLESGKETALIGADTLFAIAQDIAVQQATRSLIDLQQHTYNPYDHILLTRMDQLR